MSQSRRRLRAPNLSSTLPIVTYFRITAHAGEPHDFSCGWSFGEEHAGLPLDVKIISESLAEGLFSKADATSYAELRQQVFDAVASRAKLFREQNK
jgi:hypothetical protein